jgi:hypothetical protein
MLSRVCVSVREIHFDDNDTRYNNNDGCLRVSVRSNEHDDKALHVCAIPIFPFLFLLILFFLFFTLAIVTFLMEFYHSLMRATTNEKKWMEIDEFLAKKNEKVIQIVFLRNVFLISKGMKIFL